MRRLRPRAAVLGGVAIGLVGGVATFGAASSATVASPVTKPASFAKLAPVIVSRPDPERLRFAPCSKGQKLTNGVCVIHVVRVVIHRKPAPAPVQAVSQVQPVRYTYQPRPAPARTYQPSRPSASYQGEGGGDD